MINIDIIQKKALKGDGATPEESIALINMIKSMRIKATSDFSDNSMRIFTYAELVTAVDNALDGSCGREDFSTGVLYLWLKLSFNHKKISHADWRKHHFEFLERIQCGDTQLPLKIQTH